MKTYLTFTIVILFGTTGLFFSSVEADEVLGSYLTVISNRDRQSSSGEKLKRFEQIIRQDRANFHELNKRDEGDEGDDMYASSDARANLELYLSRGDTNPDTIRRILYGNDNGNELYVAVSVWQKSDGTRYAKVGLYGNNNE